MKFRKTYLLLMLSGLLTAMTGCASVPLKEARSAFYARQYEKAETSLSLPEKISGRDKLLLYMEKGLILHQMGKYDESTQEFLNAANLIKKQDIISVSQQAASLVSTEWITEYKGEYSERLWVHTYLMMNFLLLGKYESALVEAKQSAEIMNQYPLALSKDYFTRALIALCYETLGEINDAYIEYKKLAEAMPDPSSVMPKLYRYAVKLGFHDEAVKYKGMITKTEEEGSAEVIVFFGEGHVPKKIPGNIILPPSIRISFPQYQYQSDSNAEIAVKGASETLTPITVKTSLDAVARNSLSLRSSKIMTKEAARVMTKEAMARVVERQNHELIGALFRAVLFVTEEADTRSWETLPSSLQLIRITLKPGTYSLKLSVSRWNGQQIEDMPIEVSVSHGQRVFQSLRMTD